MTSRTPEVAEPGPAVRPLPPPIVDADLDLDRAAPPAATAFDPPEIVIVPASDRARPSPALPDRVTAHELATSWRRANCSFDDESAAGDDHRSSSSLRSDPPPLLMYTRWLRVVLAFMMVGAIGTAMWSRYDSESNDGTAAQWVVGLHAGVIGALIVWSFVSMRNADALVPATRYQSRSRGWLAASLWLIAFLAPVGGILASDAVRDLFDDPDHPNFVFVQLAIGLVVAGVVWQPFRYLAEQAHRIGTKRRPVFEWFWLPALAVGGGLLIMALGLRSDLEADGMTDVERLIEAGVLYGLPMLLFALTGWRATTAFDTVIRIRWRRWKTGWDESVAAYGIADDATK